MSEPATVRATGGEITIARVFDAPRELVFKAWTDADQVAKWFGPRGFGVPRESVEIDPRVGGHIRLRMLRGGRTLNIRYEITELVEPELLDLTAPPMPEFGLDHPIVARIELQDEGGKTRLTLTDGPYTDEGGQGAAAGWQGAFDKLHELLATPA
jgi:uncharacterized protein YndB with AHSA1/START domain